MASTFTLPKTTKNTATSAVNSAVVATADHQIEDAYATPAAQAQAMRTHAIIQAKRLDGQVRNYRIDSYRSDPSRNLIYLLPV